MGEEYGRCESCTRPTGPTMARIGKLLHISEMQPDPDCPGREYMYAVETPPPGSKEMGIRLVGGAVCHRVVTHEMRRASHQIAKHLAERGEDAILDLEASWQQADKEDRDAMPKFPGR